LTTSPRVVPPSYIDLSNKECKVKYSIIDFALREALLLSLAHNPTTVLLELMKHISTQGGPNVYLWCSQSLIFVFVLGSRTKQFMCCMHLAELVWTITVTPDLFSFESVFLSILVNECQLTSFSCTKRKSEKLKFLRKKPYPTLDLHPEPLG
jgi:hypothetical protein